MPQALVLTLQGRLYLLDCLRSGAPITLRAGLHENDSDPQSDWTAGTIEVAAFAGYTGLSPVLNWSPAALADGLGVIQAQGLLWRCAGGGASCRVFGYYAVNPAGILVWTERRPGPGQVLAVAGDTYGVRPRFSLDSRY